MNTNGSIAGKFFASGKIDIGFEVKDGYVYGVCLVYPSRSDQEHEYMIREKSIVAIGERDLSICVEDAKDYAYKAAISRLESSGNPSDSGRAAVREPTVQASVQSDKKIIDGDASNNARDVQTQTEPPIEPPVSYEQEQNDEPDLDDDLQGEEDGDDTGDIGDFEDEDEPDQSNGIQRLDLNLGLQPASNLLNNAPEPQAPTSAGNIDPDMKKALDMPITILGKLHSSFGKTAGVILETDPQCIVDFAHRYTGPKVEEKAALVKLYPEALRRVQNAA